MPWVENFQHLFKESASTERILVSTGLDLKGNLYFNGAGSVAGNIEGSLESAHHVTIDEAARITGPCEIGNLHVSGQIHGDLHSREHIRLSPESQVRGQMQAGSLEITSGADFEGPLKIGVSGSD